MQRYILTFTSEIGFNELVDDDDSFDDFDDSPLLQYCFSEHYGDNYGFRTLLEYDEECTIGENCLANGTTIGVQSDLIRRKRSKLMNDCRLISL